MKIYRKSGATKKKRSSSKKLSLTVLPHWGSFAFGGLIGILITSFIYFKFSTSEITLKIPNSSASKPVQGQNSPPPAIARPKTPQPPKFDFYNELTKNSRLDNKQKVLDLKSAPKPINGYLVQTGSFKKQHDAEALKAELALSGIISSIETAKLSDGDIWYRVLTGPYDDEKTALKQQKNLKSIDRDSIIVHRYAE